MKTRLFLIITLLVATSLACGVATKATMSQTLVATPTAPPSATKAPTLAATIAPPATPEIVYIHLSYNLRVEPKASGVTVCQVTDERVTVIPNSEIDGWIRVQAYCGIGYINKKNVMVLME